MNHAPHSTVHIEAEHATEHARHHCDYNNDRRSYALTPNLGSDIMVYIGADNPDQLGALGMRLIALAAEWTEQTTASVTDDAPPHGIDLDPTLAAIRRGATPIGDTP